MKLIIVHIGDILKYPPVISLINTLNDLSVKTDVITTESIFNKKTMDNVTFHEIPINYEQSDNPINKLINLFKIKKSVMSMIEELYCNDSLIWITYNVSLKHMNIKKLNQYNYVLQLMELMENIKYHDKLPFEINKHEVGKNALAVVVPEYNRAHITKVWWELENLPCVLHNKPYYSEVFQKNNSIDDETAKKVVSELVGKKIILYQGHLTKERPMDVFIKAVDKLGEDYALVVMSGGKNIYADVPSSNYYFIPFVSPPYHLQITSHAYIGIMMYVPVKSQFSELNVLYCAPNKTYEYGMFGVPMLGNDLPALNYLFETEKCGLCFKDYNEDSICEAIEKINDNYEMMSKNALRFYNKTDYREELLEILNTVETRITTR